MAMDFADGYDAGCKDTLRKVVWTKDIERKFIEAARAQRRALRARPPVGSSDYDAVEWSRYVREAVDAYEAALDALEAMMARIGKDLK